jgi:hypothetical protein
MKRMTNSQEGCNQVGRIGIYVQPSSPASPGFNAFLYAVITK